MSIDFRTRLLGTLRVLQPVLAEEGVMVAGTEVPNLLELGARSTLIVSQGLDIAVPVARHAAVKARLPGIRGLARSAEEPSVWLPKGPDLIEVNFIGMDTLGELEHQYRGLSAELRYGVRSGLSALSLIEPRVQMPDPTPHRGRIAALLARLERTEPDR